MWIILHWLILCDPRYGQRWGGRRGDSSSSSSSSRGGVVQMILCMQVIRKRSLGDHLAAFARYFRGAVFQQAFTIAFVVGHIAVLEVVLALLLILL